MGRYLILGVVQGLTEFLPVSSSAHLVFGKALLGLNPPGTILEGVLHLGTLLAVILCFRREIAELVVGIAKGEAKSLRYLFFLLLGTAPVVLVGLLFREEVERAFSAPRMVGGLLLVTGALLLSAERVRKRGVERALGLWTALGVGIAQAAALLPGISRSGATISVGILLGLNVREAVRFSFLLAIPAIGGASLFSVLCQSHGTGIVNAQGLIVGGMAAFLSGVAAIKTLLVFLSRGRLFPFAFYCFLVGLLALILA